MSDSDEVEESPSSRSHSRSRSPERRADPGGEARRPDMASDEAQHPEQARRLTPEERAQKCRDTIDRILGTEDPYEMLDLVRGQVNADELKRAGKKMSLFVHPDKLPSDSDYKEKADQAFKKLQNAVLKEADRLTAEEIRNREEERRQEEEEQREMELMEQLLPWQVKVFQCVREAKADPREIWYIQGMGNDGKSWFTRFCSEQFGDRFLPVDFFDVRHALHNVFENQEKLNATEKAAILFLDVPSAAKYDENFYHTLERIKDGLFQTTLRTAHGKSPTCKLDLSPHVVVTSNKELVKKDLAHLTTDRWNYQAIDPRDDDLYKMKRMETWIREIIHERFAKQVASIDDDK